MFIFDKTFSFVFLKFLSQHVDEVTFANKVNGISDFHSLEITIIYCFTSNFNITLMARCLLPRGKKNHFCESSCEYVPHHYHTFNHCLCKLAHYIFWLHPCLQFFFQRGFPNVLVVVIVHYIWCNFKFLIPQKWNLSVNVTT